MHSLNPPSTIFGTRWMISNLSFGVTPQSSAEQGERHFLVAPPVGFLHPLCRQAPLSTPSERTIIHRHSHRIRELNVYPFENPSFLCLLQATCLRPSFFAPNLRPPNWCPCGYLQPNPGAYIIYIQRLLSPSLVSLSVWLGPPGDTDETIVRPFLSNYPSSSRTCSPFP